MAAGYGTLLVPPHPGSLRASSNRTMPTRRLDDRIRKLCAEIAKTPTGSGPISPKVEATLQELLAAIHEKTERVRNLAARKLLQTKDRKEEFPKERRASP